MKFIDLFSGIGGFRLGMEMAGHECVGHCEIDKYADKSYRAMHNVKESEWFATDIRNVIPEDMPEFDILCGGFPCQSFSMAGKRGGFEDTRGTLFFEIARIISERKPKIVFLENVRGLLSHDDGSTVETILRTLGDLGYWWEYQVHNSKDFNVPQNRERVFIIGHLRGSSGRAVFPFNGTNGESDFNKIITVGKWEGTNRDTGQRIYDKKGIFATLTTKGHMSDVPKIAVKEATKQGYAMAEVGDSINLEQPNSKTRRGRVGKGIANTLTTSAQQGTLDAGVSDGIRIRRLTPKECFRLQGFPDQLFHKAEKVNSNSQLYKQAGNSVTVNVIYAIAKRIKE